MATPTPVVTILFLNTIPQPLIASVIDAQPSATAYLVNCPADPISGELPDTCGTFNQTVTVQPPSVPTPTFDALEFDPEYPFNAASGLSIHCVMTNSAGSAIPTSCDTSGSASTAITEPELSSFWRYLPITIIAGAEKLSDLTSISATPTVSATSSGSVFALTRTVTPTVTSVSTSLSSSRAASQSIGAAALAMCGLDAGVGGRCSVGLAAGQYTCVNIYGQHHPHG